MVSIAAPTEVAHLNRSSWRSRVDVAVHGVREMKSYCSRHYPAIGTTSARHSDALSPDGPSTNTQAVIRNRCSPPALSPPRRRSSTSPAVPFSSGQMCVCVVEGDTISRYHRIVVTMGLRVSAAHARTKYTDARRFSFRNNARNLVREGAGDCDITETAHGVSSHKSWVYQVHQYKCRVQPQGVAKH